MTNILVAGDFCPNNRVKQLLEEDDFESVFGNVRKYIENADFSIVNLEAPVVENNAHPIEKCGPNLKCSSKAIDALKWAGVDMVTLANNHFYDYGDEGVNQTLAVCRNSNIITIGGGKNIIESSTTVYQNIKGMRFAIINCCEEEYSIATKNTGGANSLNPIQQYYAIQEAKSKSDYIVMIVHGGHEMYQLPSLRMKELYRFFIDSGADVVINHHQHCFSGYESYNGKPIFYGIGNFSFDRSGKRNSIWNEGYMVMLYFETDKIEFELIPYVQGDERPGIEILKDRTKFDIMVAELNTVISNDVQLQEKHQEWMAKTSKRYKLALELYTNKYLEALYMRGLLPSLISKKKKLRLLGYIKCEAHLERLINVLKNSI